MNTTFKLFLVIFIPAFTLYGLGILAAIHVGAWLGVVLVMLGLTVLCMSPYWTPAVMGWLK